MEYSGKLYGKVGQTYFPLVLTTNDVDSMQEQLKKLPREQSERQNVNIPEFVQCFIKTYEPGTFVPDKYGKLFYRSEDLSSGINLISFFEDLLTDFCEKHNVK